MNHLGRSAALFISGLLAVSACSSATSGGAQGSSTETVRIGSYTQVFATALPAGHAQAKVISEFRKGQVLWERSNRAWRLVAPVTTYVTGRALADLSAAVAAGKQRHLVPAGTDRFFRTRVTALTATTATIATCDDGSKFREKDQRTGHVDQASAPKPSQSYLYETWHMVRRSGHWAISAFTLSMLPSPAARACQPPARAGTVQ